MARRPLLGDQARPSWTAGSSSGSVIALLVAVSVSDVDRAGTLSQLAVMPSAATPTKVTSSGVMVRAGAAIGEALVLVALPVVRSTTLRTGASRSQRPPALWL